MKIKFLGATGTVTGSKYLVSLSGSQLLVDCGLFQGLKQLRLKNWLQLAIPPVSLDAVILTHAHLDHSGYIPLLVKHGFAGKIYCTPATRALCEILLPDSGHLQEEDANYANRKKFSKHSPALPLYTEEDARKSLDRLVAVPFETDVKMEKGGSFRFLRAGHILGASHVLIENEGKKLLFSGDVGRLNDPLMLPPAVVTGKIDALVVESTYGNRIHDPASPEDRLGHLITQTQARGGSVLIPAFAVGRAQEILYHVSRLKKRKAIPDIPVYLNSPMADKATRLYYEFPEDQRLSVDEAREMCQGVRMVSSMEESVALVHREEANIIISASGMATGGRVLHHLKAMLPNPKHTVLFAGFQAAGTRGEALVHGVSSVKIHGMMVPVKAQIENLDNVSAHADQAEILTWLSHFKPIPKNIFITHGEPIASEVLRKKIQERFGVEALTPEYADEFTLHPQSQTP